MVFAQAGDTGRARGTRAGWKVGLGGGKNQDGCSLFSVERALDGWVGEFPLTPTLSQRLVINHIFCLPNSGTT
jgi:hypothetical protein